MRTIIFCTVLSLAAGLNSYGAEKKKSRTSTSAESQSFSRPYGMAGCGLGSLVVGKDSMQVIAATTNASTYSQLFGITSGTSNCVDGPTDEIAQRLDRFVVANKVALADDVAKGQGETLASVSTILGCKDVGKLGSAVQNNFQSIFSSHEVQPNEITDSIISVIINDSELRSSCNIVI